MSTIKLKSTDDLRSVLEEMDNRLTKIEKSILKFKNEIDDLLETEEDENDEE